MKKREKVANPQLLKYSNPPSTTLAFAVAEAH